MDFVQDDPSNHWDPLSQRLPHMFCQGRYPYIRKCAFDVGDYGFGFCANSLQLGCDCLGAIQYLDGVVNNAKGEAVVIKKVQPAAEGTKH